MFAPRDHNQSKEPGRAKPKLIDPALDKKPSSENNPVWQSLALNSATLQPKLAVSQPDDQYEREADSIADRVMRMASPPSINNKLSFASSASFKAQRKCGACEDEEEKKVQRKEQGSSVDAAATAPPIVHDTLSASGQPLDSATRDFFEPRFHRDFSRVRVHTDARASESAQAVNALAYTFGRNMVFNRGQYAPESPGGQRLIAHELAHVAQQDSGKVRLKIQRSRLRDFSDAARAEFAPEQLTDAQIEATNEFRAYMNPALVWQANEHMTRDEARLACRLMLRDIRAGVVVNWQTGARIYMNHARLLSPPTARGADQRVSPPPGPNAAIPDTGLATELGYEVDPSSRPSPAPPPPPPPPGGGPAPPPPAPPARIPWDGKVGPATGISLGIEVARAARARRTMQLELFDAYDAYLTAFRARVLAALAMPRVPFTAPAAAPGAAGPPPTGVVDIANQARDVLEARYATTMNAAAPSVSVTTGRAPLTTAAGAQNIFDASSAADRITLTGDPDLASGVAWWLFEHDRPGTRPRGTAEFATNILSRHHYSVTDDGPPRGAFRQSVANAYSAASTLAPNNQRHLIDYRLARLSEADPTESGRGFAIVSSFDPGTNPNRAELVRRWAIFKTATHESLHLRAHPVFRDARLGRGTMQEGFTEMFTVSTLNTDILPRARAGSVEPLRRTVEGALSPPAPDPTIITDHVAPTQYAVDLANAERIRDGAPGGHAGVGEAAVRAAYFQGHIEYIGLAPGGAQATGLRAAGTPEQTRIPGGITSLNDLSRRSGVPLATIQADNPGITNALPATAVLRGCREHWVVPGETRAGIATQHGVSEADLVRANPDITLDRMTNEWPPLVAGQKLLIPLH